MKDRSNGSDDSDDVNYKPDDIITQLGGCGLFQILLSIIIQSMKLVVCWVMAGNSFFAFVPRWRCVEFDGSLNSSSITSQYAGKANTNGTNVDESVTLDKYWNEQCSIGEANCVKFEYEEDLHSLVSQVSDSSTT